MFYIHGLGSFGMPAENAARQNNLSQRMDRVKYIKYECNSKDQTIDRFKQISTCSSDYYAHQQRFLELYDKGLVYRKEQDVNWDPRSNRLANEQVIDGKGWRSGAKVERKLNQWFFNITNFSEELLNSLDTLDLRPCKVKVMQKNWIGKLLVAKLNSKYHQIQILMK